MTGRLPFLGKLHRAQSLAIAFGIRLAEVAMQPLLGVAALLRAQHQHFPAAKVRHAADHRGIVAESCGRREFR